MSFPNVPDITPTIHLNRNEVVNLLLASIAIEELGLAHVMNAEGEKIQAVVGTLPGVLIPNVDIAALLTVNESLHEMMETVVKQEMLLEFKLEEVLNLMSTSSTTSTSTSTTTTSSSTTTTQTTTSASTTTTATVTTPPLFVFGNIASATGTVGDIIVTDADDAFYNSNVEPMIVGYSITESPIIGVPTIMQPSIQVVKQVSIDEGASWVDANVPNGPSLPSGSKPWFRITVSNNGNVPLMNVTVTDPSLGLVSIIPTLVDGAGVQWIAVPL